MRSCHLLQFYRYSLGNCSRSRVSTRKLALSRLSCLQRWARVGTPGARAVRRQGGGVKQPAVGPNPDTTARRSERVVMWTSVNPANVWAVVAGTLGLYEQCGGKTGPTDDPPPALGDFAWVTAGGPACAAGEACVRQVRRECDSNDLKQEALGEAVSSVVELHPAG